MEDGEDVAEVTDWLCGCYVGCGETFYIFSRKDADFILTFRGFAQSTTVLEEPALGIRMLPARTRQGARSLTLTVRAQ
jgi:hypothetical protein